MQEEDIRQLIKSIDTTMIGALSKFENVFGYLWGHYKGPDEQLTDQEMYFDNMWQDVRNNILNHGNKQKRVLQDKISGPQYKYRFPVIKNKENRE